MSIAQGPKLRKYGGGAPWEVEECETDGEGFGGEEGEIGSFISGRGLGSLGSLGKGLGFGLGMGMTGGGGVGERMEFVAGGLGLGMGSGNRKKKSTDSNQFPESQATFNLPSTSTPFLGGSTASRGEKRILNLNPTFKRSNTDLPSLPISTSLSKSSTTSSPSPPISNASLLTSSTPLKGRGPGSGGKSSSGSRSRRPDSSSSTLSRFTIKGFGAGAFGEALKPLGFGRRGSEGVEKSMQQKKVDEPHYIRRRDGSENGSMGRSRSDAGIPIPSGSATGLSLRGFDSASTLDTTGRSGARSIGSAVSDSPETGLVRSPLSQVSMLSTEDALLEGDSRSVAASPPRSRKQGLLSDGSPSRSRKHQGRPQTSPPTGPNTSSPVRGLTIHAIPPRSGSNRIKQQEEKRRMSVASPQMMKMAFEDAPEDSVSVLMESPRSRRSNSSRTFSIQQSYPASREAKMELAVNSLMGTGRSNSLGQSSGKSIAAMSQPRKQKSIETLALPEMGVGRGRTTSETGLKMNAKGKPFPLKKERALSVIDSTPPISPARVETLVKPQETKQLSLRPVDRGENTPPAGLIKAPSFLNDSTPTKLLPPKADKAVKTKKSGLLKFLKKKDKVEVKTTIIRHETSAERLSDAAKIREAYIASQGPSPMKVKPWQEPVHVIAPAPSRSSIGDPSPPVSPPDVVAARLDPVSPVRKQARATSYIHTPPKDSQIVVPPLKLRPVSMMFPELATPPRTGDPTLSSALESYSFPARSPLVPDRKDSLLPPLDDRRSGSPAMSSVDPAYREPSDVSSSGGRDDAAMVTYLEQKITTIRTAWRAQICALESQIGELREEVTSAQALTSALVATHRSNTSFIPGQGQSCPTCGCDCAEKKREEGRAKGEAVGIMNRPRAPTGVGRSMFGNGALRD